MVRTFGPLPALLVCLSAVGCTSGTIGGGLPNGDAGLSTDRGSDGGVTVADGAVNIDGATGTDGAAIAGDASVVADAAVAANDQLRWTYALAGGGPDEDRARGAACEPSGRCVITGEVRAGTVAFDQRQEEITTTTAYFWPIAADGQPGGPVLFDGAVGVDIDLQSSGVAVIAGTLIGTIATSTGSIVAEQGGRDAFVAGISPAGEVLFGTAFGSTGADAGNEVVVGPNDELAIVGPFGQGSGTELVLPNGSKLPFTGGDQDVFVVRLASDGSFVWGKAIAGDAHEEGRGVSMGSDGSVLVCGEFDGTLTFGSTQYTSHGDADIFVVVYDATGQVRWSRAFGGTGYDACRGIDPGANGEVVISGEYTGDVDFDSERLSNRGSGTRDIFIARLAAADGKILGVRGIGSAGDDIGCEIEVGSDGKIWCAGSAGGPLDVPGADGPSTGSSNQFVVRLDADLTNPIGVVSGDTGTVVSFAVGLNGQDRGVVVGNFIGDVSFGDVLLHSDGTVRHPDFFVAGFALEAALR